MYNTYNIQKCVNWPFKFAVKLSSWLWVVKFGEGQKLYAGFQLCEELAPLTPEFFKGWLYFLFLVLPESFSLYSPKIISVILPVLLCAWPAHLNMYELFKHPPGWGAGGRGETVNQKLHLFLLARGCHYHRVGTFTGKNRRGKDRGTFWLLF